jgi:hypothetical protein
MSDWTRAAGYRDCRFRKLKLRIKAICEWEVNSEKRAALHGPRKQVACMEGVWHFFQPCKNALVVPRGRSHKVTTCLGRDPIEFKRVSLGDLSARHLVGDQSLPELCLDAQPFNSGITQTVRG